MAVDGVGRHAGSWCDIQGSTPNHENEAKTHNLGWMLYSVYVVLGVCCTQCQLMIMAWWDREGWLNCVFCEDDRAVDKKEKAGGWRWERRGENERMWEIRGTTYLIGLGRPRIGEITHRMGTRTCRIGDGKLTHTKFSKYQILMIIYPISSHLSPSHPQLYCHLRTRS